MALVSLNTINVDKGVSDDFYSEIILYPLITDSGPNGYTLVSSLNDLRITFRPAYNSYNWIYAETLLSLGYRLLIAKLTKIEDYLSLRIFESYKETKEDKVKTNIITGELDPKTGFKPQYEERTVLKDRIIEVPTTCSHPKKYFDYSKISVPWNPSSSSPVILPEGFTYSVKIPLPDSFFSGNYVFLTLKHDEYLTYNGQLNRMICFGDKKDFSGKIVSNVATDVKYISLTDNNVNRDRELIVSDFIDILNHFGIYVNKRYDDMLVVTSLHPIKKDNTCCYSKFIDGDISQNLLLTSEDKESTYDIICEISDDRKLVDFYSKENLSVDCISLNVIKNFDNNYSIFINIEDDSGASVKSEYFRVSMDPKSNIFISNVIKSSEIVECIWYKNGDISGSFKLRTRNDPEDVSFGNMLEVLESLPKLEDGDFDILVDGGLGDVFQKSLYNTYKDFMCVKIFQLTHEINNEDGSKVLFIPPNRKDGVQYCNKYFSINGVVYPLWIGILAKIKKQGLFSGDLSIGFSLDPMYLDANGESQYYIVEEDDYLCSLIFDGYRHIIPSTPIKMGNSTYSLDLLWLVTLIRNRVIPSINPNMSQDDFIRAFNSRIKSLLDNKQSRISGVVITKYKKTDRLLTLEIIIIHDNTFIDSVSLELTIKIN